MIVEHPLGVQIVRISRILFELCLLEKKKKEEEENEEERTKSKFSRLIFSTVRRSNGTLGYILHKNS